MFINILNIYMKRKNTLKYLRLRLIVYNMFLKMNKLFKDSLLSATLRGMIRCSLYAQ